MPWSDLLFLKQRKSESQQGLRSHLHSTSLGQVPNAVVEALEHILESML